MNKFQDVHDIDIFNIFKIKELNRDHKQLLYIRNKVINKNNKKYDYFIYELIFFRIDLNIFIFIALNSNTYNTSNRIKCECHDNKNNLILEIKKSK